MEINKEKAFELFKEEFKKRNGKKFVPQNGRKEVAVFDNCTMIIFKEDDFLVMQLYDGKPIEISASINLF